MAYETIGKLIDLWFADSVFRENLRKDPEGTIQKSGVNLNQEEWAAFRKIDWNLSNNELEQRASKLFA